VTLDRSAALPPRAPDRGHSQPLFSISIQIVGPVAVDHGAGVHAQDPSILAVPAEDVFYAGTPDGIAAPDDVDVPCPSADPAVTAFAGTRPRENTTDDNGTTIHGH
jgi:hypothetical protein